MNHGFLEVRSLHHRDWLRHGVSDQRLHGITNMNKALAVLIELHAESSDWRTPAINARIRQVAKEFAVSEDALTRAFNAACPVKP